MAKNKKKQTPVAKDNKIDPLILSIALIGGVFAIYLAAAFGTAMDNTLDKNGKTQIGAAFSQLETTMSKPDFVIQSLLKGGNAAKVTMVAVFAVGIFALYQFTKKSKKLHRKGTEHGSAAWAKDEEVKELADNGEKTKEVKFLPMRNDDGSKKFDKNGEILCAKIDNNMLFSKEVKMSLNTRQHLLNLNTLIVGGSGSGKTRFVAKPNIMQLNTSYVITDPKGEILQSTGKMLKEAGYIVKVFNLINMKNSNNYNPFAYVYDFEGNLVDEKVIKMIDTLMKNTKGDGDKDDFWSISAQKLLTAIVFLLFEESEYNAKFDKDGNIIKGTRDLSNLNISAIGEKLRKISYPANPQEAEGFRSELGKDYDILAEKKGETLAGKYYKEFEIAPAETGQSIVSTASARIQMFNLRGVADLTCCDDLELDKIGDKKTALFIIISASDKTYNFLASMMYTQMFNSLDERANFFHGGRLPIHVRCILDEFANLSQIPDFDTKISTFRSMEISVTIILQTIDQLKAKYEKTHSVIFDACDTFLFLGGKGIETTKQISEMLGKETIDVESKNRTKAAKSNSTSESNSILGRELLTPNELITLDVSKCILIAKAHNPFLCTKYPIEKHPNFKFLEDYDKKNKFDYSDIKGNLRKPYFQSNFLRRNQVSS